MATDFGKALKEYRKREKLSLEDMAKMLDTTKQALSRYERGERQPKISVAAKFSEILGIPMVELAGGSDYPQSSEQNDDTFSYEPQNENVQLFIQDIHKMNPEDVERLIDMSRLMFANSYPNLFKKGKEDEKDT